MLRIEETRMPSEQLARPIMWPGDFVTAGSPNAVSINPKNPAVHPGIMCLKCRPISKWLTTEQWEHEQPGHPPREALRNFSCEGKFWHEFEHYQTGLQLEESYKEGCHLCTLIWQATVEKGKASWPGASRADIPSPSERSKWKKTRLTQIRRSKNVKIKIRYHDIAENRYNTADSLKPRFELIAQVAVSERSQLTRTSAAIEIGPWPSYARSVKKTDLHIWTESSVRLTASADFVSTSSSSVIQQAARWLDQCVSNHATCRHATTPTLPRRLLYLETINKKIQVKLVESDKNFSNLKYATLSYCWGKGSAYKLTRANLETMRSGILLSDLPKTIQDALHVTQQLGLHWLWVDSLCIIQDSVDDWSSEAATMVDVYQNCFVCIAATGASSSNKGLFAQRDPYIYQPCPLSNNSDANTLFAYPHRGLGDKGDFNLCFFESPLHKRGWVMQERLLPPRTLSFGSIVVWECCEHYRDEFCLSRGIEGNTLKGDFSSLVLQQVSPRQIAPEEETRILSLWQTIIRAYTQANLTVKTDKLVALSGIIRAIERSTGWRNIYGVWEPFLAYELLWRKQVFNRLETTALPGASWSWVSWDGGIHQPIAYSRRVMDNALASFQGFDLQVWPGQVQRALIRISCVLFEIQSPGFDMIGPRYIIKTGSHDYPIEITKDLRRGEMNPEIFLPLLYNVPSLNSWIDSLDVQGLALTPSSSSPGAYERVGYATLSSEKLFIQPILDGSSLKKRQIITLV